MIPLRDSSDDTNARSHPTDFEVWRAQGRLHLVQGRHLFVLDVGSGAPVLFLHGIPTYSFLWRDVIPYVARNYRAIAPDLLGFGLSDKPRQADYTIERQAELLLTLLDDLDVERCALVAHDAGALVAAELLARDPDRVRTLVILNTSLRRDRWRGSSILSLLRVPLLGELGMLLARRWMLNLAMNVYVARRNRLTNAVMSGYWWPFQHGFKSTLLRLSRTDWATDAAFARWRAALARFAGPRLIIWGALDPTFDLSQANDLNTLMAGARLQVFDHANHFVPEDRPLALGRLITAFLREQARENAPPLAS